MNERVERLRTQSVETRPYISTERARLITEFYKSDVVRKVSTPVCRALALKYLVENRTICINAGELIVGERGRRRRPRRRIRSFAAIAWRTCGSSTAGSGRRSRSAKRIDGSTSRRSFLSGAARRSAIGCSS